MSERPQTSAARRLLLRLHLWEVDLVRAFARHERRRLLRPLMLFATRCADGWALAAIVPGVLLVWGRGPGVAAVVTGTVSSVALALLVHGIKSVVRRARPAGIELLRPIGAPDVHAFPSGHTAHAFALTVLLGLLAPWAGLAFLPVALAVGVSRVFFALHFPSDVVAGAALGAVTSLVTARLLHAIGWVVWPVFG